jgi:hypothetical protein
MRNYVSKFGLGFMYAHDKTTAHYVVSRTCKALWLALSSNYLPVNDFNHSLID